MTWKLLTIAFAWLIFFCFWIAGIFIYKQSVQRHRDKRWFIFLFSIILITLTTELLAGKYLLKRLDFSPSGDALAEITGTILLLSGLSFAIWARITLGRFWSGSVVVIKDQPVVKGGPYAIVRHPIYTGVIAMLWGSFLLERIGFVLLIAVLGTIFLLWKARLEEEALAKADGIEYAAYKKEVPGF